MDIRKMIELYSDTEPDANQRRCYDCGFLKGAVSLWCTNEEAFEARGTRIPGIRECPYWKPMGRNKMKSVEDYEKLIESVLVIKGTEPEKKRWEMDWSALAIGVSIALVILGLVIFVGYLEGAF